MEITGMGVNLLETTSSQHLLPESAVSQGSGPMAHVLVSLGVRE